MCVSQNHKVLKGKWGFFWLKKVAALCLDLGHGQDHGKHVQECHCLIVKCYAHQRMHISCTCEASLSFKNCHLHHLAEDQAEDSLSQAENVSSSSMRNPYKIQCDFFEKPTKHSYRCTGRRMSTP